MYTQVCVYVYICTQYIYLYIIYLKTGFTNVPIHEDSSQLAHFHVCKSLLRQWETWLPLFLMYLLICSVNYILNVAKIPTTLPSPPLSTVPLLPRHHIPFSPTLFFATYIFRREGGQARKRKEGGSGSDAAFRPQFFLMGDNLWMNDNLPLMPFLSRLKLPHS